MSAEKIIAKIQQDAKQQLTTIQKEAEKKAQIIHDRLVDTAKQQAEHITTQGKQDAEHLKHIKIAQANQEIKRRLMAAREELIDQCFTQAQQRLKDLHQKKYQEIVSQLVADGKKKLGDDCSVRISRDEDKKIIEKHGLTVQGSVDASGGVILVSSDGNVTLDNTFEGILRRKKDSIRIQVGKLLFSDKSME